MISMILTVMIIIALAFFFYKTLSFYPEESIMMAIMSIVFLIYVIGLITTTDIALVAIYGMAFIGMFQFLTNRRLFWIPEKNNNLRREFFSPNVVIIIIGCVYAFLAFRNVLIHNWDELAQWGKAANYMVWNDQLINHGNFDGSSKLISSTTFFHYFFQKIHYLLTNSINDSLYYISNFVLWFSAVFLPLSGHKWKDVKKIVLYTVTIILLMNLIFLQPSYNIYCDQACVIWTGALIAWFMYGKRSSFSPVLTLLLLWNIGLSKSMIGPLFAIIAVIVICIVYFFEYVSEIDNIKKFLKKVNFKQYLYIVALFICSVIPTAIWSIMVKQNALIRTGGYNNSSDRFTLTVKNAIKKLFVYTSSHGGFLKLSYFTFFIIAVLLGIVLFKYYFENEKKKEYSIIFSLYYIGFALYWIILVYAYLTAFGYADSIIAASMERYLASYMILGLLPMLVPIFTTEKASNITSLEKKVIRFLPICIVLVLCLNIEGSFAGRLTTWYLYQEKAYKTRKSIKTDAEKLKILTGEKGKIYMISQSSNTFPIVVADYELGLQLKRDNMPSYFQNPEKGVKDIAGLREEDIEKFPEILEEEGYSYLWIYKKNEYFEKYLKDEFSVSKLNNGDVFKIQKSASNKNKLQYLCNIKKIEEETSNE